MHNLEQIQQNLHILIQQLKTIQQKSKHPVTAAHYNSGTVLLKIPKVILLSKICIYIDNNDIINLSSTCKIMRKTIYGPLGWKILSFKLNKYPLIIKSIDTTQHQSNNQDLYNIHMNLQYEDQKFLRKQRVKYKQILLKKYQTYNKAKQKYQGHCQKLKVAKTYLLKMKNQQQYYHAIKNHYQNSNIQYKQKLKKLSSGFLEKIKKMDQDNDNLAKERTKLQNQKQALAGKVRQYQFQIEKIKQQSQKAKQILKKLKNYLLFKQL